MTPNIQFRTSKSASEFSGTNPLPSLLQTPSGLALLELQGTINLPDATAIESDVRQETSIGRLVFPTYVAGDSSTAWMKRVYMYVGKHQRLTGEVKKLPKAIAVIRRAVNQDSDEQEGEEGDGGTLEVVEIVKYKILFSSRPEPVGASAIGDANA